MGYMMCMYTNDYEETQSLANSQEAEEIDLDAMLTAEEIEILSN
ncbi:MAG TPA: hypothetical protein VHV99_27325 [Paraburkholderia sp.]|jgi:hypothetical protein|nr:hypothetical protein [Paraburkholderia sp.]